MREDKFYATVLSKVLPRACNGTYYMTRPGIIQSIPLEDPKKEEDILKSYGHSRNMDGEITVALHFDFSYTSKSFVIESISDVSRVLKGYVVYLDFRNIPFTLERVSLFNPTKPAAEAIKDGKIPNYTDVKYYTKNKYTIVARDRTGKMRIKNVPLFFFGWESYGKGSKMITNYQEMYLRIFNMERSNVEDGFAAAVPHLLGNKGNFTKLPNILGERINSISYVLGRFIGFQAL